MKYSFMMFAFAAFLGCENPHGSLGQGTTGCAAGSDSRHLIRPDASADNVSGDWAWVTTLGDKALTKQTCTIKRQGDNVSGKVLWLIDEGYSADVSNGRTDGTRASFDATFVVRDAVDHRVVRVKFSYVGVFSEGNRTRGKRLLGTYTITGFEGGKSVTIEHPWNAYPEP